MEAARTRFDRRRADLRQRDQNLVLMRDQNRGDVGPPRATRDGLTSHHCPPLHAYLIITFKSTGGRVQLGVALTPAEKLKVIMTPRATFVRKLQDEFLNKNDAGLVVMRSRGIGRGGVIFVALATITYLHMTASLPSARTLGAYPIPCSRFNLNPAFAASIENTYRVYTKFVGEPRHSEHFTKIAPVEFIMTGILVHRHKARLGLEGLAKAVSAMRADVRTQHQDVRNNGKMYKTMVAFIDGYNGDVTQGEVWAKDAVDGPTAGGASGSKTGAKRKAARAPADDEDSDDDYAPRKRERASPKKAIALPTPPSSSTSAPAPTPTAPPGYSVPGLDVVRQAKERLAKRP
ncbi:hypothetical protein B0H13DRAFT_2522201 [Mycena leptocephala]|nr:hypothetical protein B0H13DRAFT_2522201 [Mycena leptocephala]